MDYKLHFRSVPASSNYYLYYFLDIMLTNVYFRLHFLSGFASSNS